MPNLMAPLWHGGDASHEEGRPERDRNASSVGGLSAIWSAEDFLRVLVGTALSLIGIIVMWYLASDTASTSRQLLIIAIGGGFVVIGILAMTRWLIIGFAQLRSDRERIIAYNRDRLSSPIRRPKSPRRELSEPVVFLGNGVRYHLTVDCQLLVGKVPIRPISRSEA